MGSLKGALVKSNRFSPEMADYITSATGDPTKILSWGPLERAKMATTLTKIKTDLNNQAANAGLKPKAAVEFNTAQPVK